MGATKRGYMPGQFLCRGGAPSLRRNSAETCCYTAVPGTSVAAARLSRATRYLMALGTPQRETNTKVMTKHKTEHTRTHKKPGAKYSSGENVLYWTCLQKHTASALSAVSALPFTTETHGVHCSYISTIWSLPHAMKIHNKTIHGAYGTTVTTSGNASQRPSDSKKISHV